MERLSVRQQAIRDQEALILDTAREMLLDQGYYRMTMDRIAEACECPKSTIYQRFACKEDIVAVLAADALQCRLEMMKRGASYAGNTRERLVAIGESTSLYSRLHPNDSRIIHIATGPIREKASPLRLEGLQRAEQESLAVVLGLMEEAVASGELPLSPPATVQQVAFGLWALVEGVYILAENNQPQSALGVVHPVQELWWIFNRLADTYGWRPFYNDQDWEERLADIRRQLFPEEAQWLYGKEAWFGDAGREHPGERSGVTQAHL